MAQDNQKQGQQNPPARPVGQLDDSLFYHKDNAPADIAPPVRGLLNRGWRCQADNPQLSNGLWFPPEGRDTDLVRSANLFGTVMRPSENPKEVDADGNPLSVPYFEQLKRQTGRDQTGAETTPIKQTIITPAARGISFQEALAVERAKVMPARKQEEKGKERLQLAGAA